MINSIITVTPDSVFSPEYLMLRLATLVHCCDENRLDGAGCLSLEVPVAVYRRKLMSVGQDPTQSQQDGWEGYHVDALTKPKKESIR